MVVQSGLKAGQMLKAVSDPAAPGNMWEVEHRSSLRHILDQFRMVQSGVVQLEFFPGAEHGFMHIVTKFASSANHL